MRRAELLLRMDAYILLGVVNFLQNFKIKIMVDLFGNKTVSKKLDPTQIIKQAIEDYKPIKALLLFSGGHDSMCSTHVSAQILKKEGIDFEVYHGDTTICIPETRKYVKDICKKYGWKLTIRKPLKGERYEDIVREYGFPGPAKQAHKIMYRRLKERALRRYVTHEVKSSPKVRENVLLLSGVRQSESNIRMGYKDVTTKEGSRIWTAPCFFWETWQQKKYMTLNNIPENEVKKTIGISGECLCGCFADKGEFDRIAQHYPHVADKIDELHEIAKENGHNWFWTQSPKDWHEMHPEGQLKLESFNLGMCSSCTKIKTA